MKISDKIYNTQLINSESGFTLVEIIVSLILAAIIFSIAGIGIITGTQGYIFSMENAHTAQKAQIAMTRINRELMELVDISNASSSLIVFETVSETVSEDTSTRTIGLVGNVIKIAEGEDSIENGDTLVDNVETDGFSLVYKTDDGNWTQGDDINSLTSIEFELKFVRADVSSGIITFSTTVCPRNIQ